MQAVSRKPGQCIFCAFSSRYQFSTSPTSQRSVTVQRFNPRSAEYGGAVSRKRRTKKEILRLNRESRESGPDGQILLIGADYKSFGPGIRNGAAFGPRQVFKARHNALPPRLTSNGLIKERLHEQENLLLKDPVYKKLDVSHAILKSHFKEFKDKITDSLGKDANDADPLLGRLRNLCQYSRADALDVQLKYSFYGHVLASRRSHEENQNQQKLGNLRFPGEWFPATRSFNREFHLHVGPTNSGKTYQALKRLEHAKTGLYAGPLRLLAHEVYMRLNARGQRCNLITGDERKTADDDPEAPMVSCTVEMIPLNAELDVAVIDEIQLIGSDDRGWAWTQAVLGVQAKEVHLCGEERSIPIIQELVGACGEKLHIHRYHRLSPLKLASKSLDGDLRYLQKGDCIVAFSIYLIHGLRQAIQKSHKCKVAVIYGSLPPETRAQQARLFNDPDNDYDILVASNAVGMGLNLSIKRMIFFTAGRLIGDKFEALPVAEIKQIAGRAGRYSTAEADMKKSVTDNKPSVMSPASPDVIAPLAPVKSIGLVTTFEREDFPLVEAAMNSEAEPITSAGLHPPAYIMEQFAKHFPPETPFSYLLMRMQEISQVTSRFHLCDLQTQMSIADAIEPIDGLTTTDKLILCSAPIEPRKPGESELVRAYARVIVESRGVGILEIEELELDLLGEDYIASTGYLRSLEQLHKGVITWMWLSYRFIGLFLKKNLALHVKELVEARIEAVLDQLSFDFDKIRKSRERAITKLLEQKAYEQSVVDETINKADEPIDLDVADVAMQNWLEGMAHYVTDDGGPKDSVQELVHTPVLDLKLPNNSGRTDALTETTSVNMSQESKLEHVADAIGSRPGEEDIHEIECNDRLGTSKHDLLEPLYGGPLIQEGGHKPYIPSDPKQAPLGSA